MTTKNRFIIIMVVIFAVAMLVTVALGFFFYSQNIYLWVYGENLFEWAYWKYISGLAGFIAMFIYWLIHVNKTRP